MKRCGRLSIKPLFGRYDERYYRPACAEDSLVEGREGGYAVGYVTVFQGCPTDCRRYVSVRRQKMRSWRRRAYWEGRQNVVGIADYFRSLPASVQVTLLAVILALVGIPYRGLLHDILEIVKAILGK